MTLEFSALRGRIQCGSDHAGSHAIAKIPKDAWQCSGCHGMWSGPAYRALLALQSEGGAAPIATYLQGRAWGDVVSLGSVTLSWDLQLQEWQARVPHDDGGSVWEVRTLAELDRLAALPEAL